MKAYIYIAAGGFFGAVLRFAVKNAEIFNYKGSFPVNTLLVNVTGSLILAFILTLALEMAKIEENAKLGITVGFLGAYTTFSTMCKELTMLILNNDYETALLYVLLSVTLGLLAVYAGIMSVRVSIKCYIRKTSQK